MWFWKQYNAFNVQQGVEISLKLSWARFHYTMYMCDVQQRLLQDPWYNLDRKQRFWFCVA